MFAALHKDLLAHLDGHTLAHPLLEWPYAYPAFYARLNRWYEHKRAVMAGTHTANEWDMFHPNLDLDERLDKYIYCLLYTSPSPRDLSTSRMPSSA